VTAFADDLCICYAAHTSLDLIADINYDVDILRKWFCVHYLNISNKTRLMYVSLTTNESPDIDIHFHDPHCKKFCLSSNCSKTFDNSLPCKPQCFKIEYVKSFKYLGIIVDNNLNWREHTNSLKIYLRTVIRKLFHLKKVCSSKMLKMIYYGLFHSKINYGIVCWGSSYTNKIRPLLLLQKCAVRMINFASVGTPSFNLFVNSNILPIRHLFYFRVLKCFFLNVIVLPADLIQCIF